MNAPITENIIKKRGEIRDHALYRKCEEFEDALREMWQWAPANHSGPLDEAIRKAEKILFGE
jgi:hypothetical protein